MRIYEWAKIIIKEKVNIFFRGFIGFGLTTGIFLFGSSFDGTTAFLLAYFIKLVAVLISGVLGGFATILGNDIYQWAKAKIQNKKQLVRQRRKKKAA